jgi:hypothetical protein
MSLPLHLGSETDPVSKMLCSLAFIILDNTPSPKTVISSQNPLESTCCILTRTPSLQSVTATPLPTLDDNHFLIFMCLSTYRKDGPGQMAIWTESSRTV